MGFGHAPPIMDPQLIYQDENLLVLNKPAGLLIHGTREKRQEASLADWLLNNYPEVRAVGDDPVSPPGIFSPFY